MQPHDWRRISRSLSESEVERAAEQIEAKRVAREQLEAEHGQVWDSFELARDFEVEAFATPRVVVVRRCDGAHGTLTFQYCPRFYWGFEKSW